jgi:steroid delta-isomerase-like uncharacterized protein
MCLGACHKEAIKAEKPEPVTKTPDTPDSKPDQPKELTASDFARQIEMAWAVHDKGDWDAYGNYFADDTTLEMVDSGMPLVKGKDALLGMIKGMQEGWSDTKREGVLVFASGNRVVTIDLMTGTNTGEFMGAPATNKKVGMLMVHSYELNKEGKIQTQTAYMDHLTMMGQLGAHKNLHRTAMEPTGKNAEPIVSAGDDKEKANLALVAAMDERLSSGKTDEVLAMLAEDFVLSDQSMHEDLDKMKMRLLVTARAKAFPDLTQNTEWAIACGDYVVRADSFSGTNTGDVPEMGMKATNKHLEIRELAVFHIADGKAKQIWAFSNGMAVQVQLGLMKPPPAPQK